MNSGFWSWKMDDRSKVGAPIGPGQSSTGTKKTGFFLQHEKNAGLQIVFTRSMGLCPAKRWEFFVLA